MAKKIRFPLEMPDGEKVRDLDSLREHFDLETVLSYFNNGKLVTWLQDRYLLEEAEVISSLTPDVTDFQKQLCDILGVKYEKSVDIEAVKLREERLTRLREFTDEKEYIDHIDQVAFDQDELFDLLDKDVKTIFLCGGKFMIPMAARGITYIGINTPSAHLEGNLPNDSARMDIIFQNVTCDNIPKEKEPVEEIPQENVYVSADSLPCDCPPALSVSWDPKPRFVGFLYRLGVPNYIALASVLVADLACTTLTDLLHLDRQKIEAAGITEQTILEFPSRLKSTLNKKYDYEILGLIGIPYITSERARAILDEMLPIDDSYQLKNKVFVPDISQVAYDIVKKLFDPYSSTFSSSVEMKIVETYLTSETFHADMETFRKIFVRHSPREIRLRPGHTQDYEFDYLDYDDTVHRLECYPPSYSVDNSFLSTTTGGLKAALKSYRSIIESSKDNDLSQSNLRVQNASKVANVFQMLEAVTRLHIREQAIPGQDYRQYPGQVL